MSVIWLEDARNDVIRITEFIAKENPAAARQVSRELVLAGDGLTLFPNRGRPGRVPGTRELVIVRPYILVYDIDADRTVFILRIWHGAQERS